MLLDLPYNYIVRLFFNMFALFYVCVIVLDIRIEGWLSILNRDRPRRQGMWKKQYVVVNSKKIFFYDSEADKQSARPNVIIDLR